MIQFSLDRNKNITVAFDEGSESWFIINRNDEVFNVSKEKNLTSLLQLLEESPQDFVERIRSLTTSNEAITNLPISDLIEFCIENHLIYWLSLAVKWLQFFPISENLKNAITGIREDKAFPQKLRHELLKAIK
jgi:hypothetical protein